MSDRLRESGNAAYRANDLRTAVRLYVEAVEASEGQDHLALCNLSAAHARLAAAPSLSEPARARHLAAAVEAARRATRVVPHYAKAHYRLAQALRAREQWREALSEVRECVRCLPEGAAVPADVAELRQAVESAWLAHHYGAAVRALGGAVSVRMCADAAVRGKGVFACTAAEPGQVLFAEAPLVSHVEAECPASLRARTCSHCMRSILTREHAAALLAAPQPGRALSSTLTDFLEHADAPVCRCAACGEVYCSRECRAAAWARYHCLLCASTPAAKAAADEYRSLARQVGLTAPLCIARMAAGVAADVLRTDVLLSTALEPYSAFEWRPWPLAAPSGTEERFRELLRTVMMAAASPLQKDAPEAPSPALPSSSSSVVVAKSAAEEEWRKKREQVVAAVTSQEVFRMLHGVLQLNASRVQPVSDVHALLCRTLPAARAAEVLAADWARRLAAGGTALFRVANSANHSCAPNCRFASADNSHCLSVLATRAVAPGDELLVSYIDENQPYEARQQQLLERYCFHCTCPKCTARQ